MSGEKVFHGVKKLRAPERLAFLEVDRAVSESLRGLGARTVLDIGTGSGIFAEAFAGRGLVVTGIDLQEEMLEAARTFVPGARFERAASEDLPFAGDSFDICFLGLVLHESDRPRRAVEEAYRTCRMRTAVLEWPDREQPIGPPLGHRLKTDDLLRLAAAAGFVQVRAVPLTHLTLFLFDKKSGGAGDR
jgi:ubiquinone/menaquinone biosynthesis C-methylase UbiE